ncbi:hypothetical protein ACFE04_013074 [Oxalis oulophora]
MAYKGMVILLLVTVLCGAATGQSSCTNVLITLSPCLNYITGNSLTPSTQCCSQLGSVVRSSPQCLCQVVLNDGGASVGISINQTRALALPGACNIQTPSISLCNAASPVGPPAGARKSPTTIPTGTYDQPGGGYKSVPSKEETGVSHASFIKLSNSLLILLLAASYISIFPAN